MKGNGENYVLRPPPPPLLIRSVSSLKLNNKNYENTKLIKLSFFLLNHNVVSQDLN